MIETEHNTEQIAPPPPLAKVSLAQQMDARMAGIETELELSRTETNTVYFTFIRKTAQIETSLKVIMWASVVIAVLLFVLAFIGGVIIGRLP